MFQILSLTKWSSSKIQSSMSVLHNIPKVDELEGKKDDTICKIILKRCHWKSCHKWRKVSNVTKYNTYCTDAHTTLSFFLAIHKFSVNLIRYLQLQGQDRWTNQPEQGLSDPPSHWLGTIDVHWLWPSCTHEWKKENKISVLSDGMTC
jgi:hypothetical protein